MQSIKEIPRSAKGKDTKPLPVRDIAQEMTALFNLTDTQAFSGDKGEGMLRAFRNTRIKNGHNLLASQCFVIDATIGYQLALHHGVAISDTDYWVEGILIKANHRYTDWGIQDSTSYEDQPHFKLSLLAPLKRALLTDGVIYAGSADEMYREAIALNADELQHGSIWTIDSVEANKIKAALVGRGIDSEMVFIHTEESLTSNKVLMPNDYTFCQSSILIAIEHKLKEMPEAVQEGYEAAINAVFTFNRQLGLKTNSLSIDDFTLPRLVELMGVISHKEGKYGSFNFDAKKALIAFSDYFGGVIGECPIATGKAMQHYNETMETAKEFCELYSQIFVDTAQDTECAFVIDELVTPDGSHHIFVGERLSLLFSTFIHEFVNVWSFNWKELPYVNLANYKVRFHEQTEWLATALLVLPAAGVRLPTPLNVFFHRDALKSKWGREELASANCYARVAVISHPLSIDTITNIFMEHLKMGRYINESNSFEKGLYFSQQDYEFTTKIVIV
ncbi:hypothetical protein OTK49_01715 [Vibrio coralliirubri]|uniref:hypothetical protein n=1 Tax=Vibrio coralliirubri TaxID=1516159 RepID=UPI00228397D5|nr:hypothetical protein [Vibrio coralliirubri]MCY9861230.1 hypothetical protein [Vibrio coralliirubri]